MRKDLGNIFEGWSFFCYVFTHCWLLPWRTKLKLTPSTKLADTKCKTSKTALKTDLQCWTIFQLAFLQLMYQSSEIHSRTQDKRETRELSGLQVHVTRSTQAMALALPSNLKWRPISSQHHAHDLCDLQPNSCHSEACA